MPTLTPSHPESEGILVVQEAGSTAPPSELESPEQPTSHSEEPVTVEPTPHEAVAAGLREFADWIEKHPEIEIPYELRGSYGCLQIFGQDSKEDLAKVARAFGKCEKATDETFYRVSRTFGPFRVEAISYRTQVCKRVQVGTKVVTKTHPDYKPRPRTIEVEEPVYEWECPESLLEAAS